MNNLYVHISNTKHVFKLFTRNLSEYCIGRLIHIGMIEPLCISVEEYKVPFKTEMTYFKSSRPIPPTNLIGNVNMSPNEPYTFVI